MASIEWSDDLSVGIAEIDAQHRQLLELIGELEATVAASAPPELLMPVFNAMLNYAATHFATEEELMAAQAYPELVPHTAEHDLFVMKLNRFRVELTAGKPTVGESMLEYLLLWVRHHVLTTDQAYAPWLHDRGIK